MLACLYNLSKYFSPLALHFLNIIQVINLKHKEHTTRKRAAKATGNLLQNSSTNADKYLLSEKGSPATPLPQMRPRRVCSCVTVQPNRVAAMGSAPLASSSGRGCRLRTSLPDSTIQPPDTARQSCVHTMLTRSVSLTHLKSYKLRCLSSLITSTEALTTALLEGSYFCFTLSSPGAMRPPSLNCDLHCSILHYYHCYCN